MIEFNMSLPPINLWTTNRLTKKESKMFIKLYTSPTCTNCGPVKDRLIAAGLDFEIRDVSHPEARDELFSHGVRAVPYLHAVNAHGSEYKALGGGINVQSLKGMMDA